MNSDRRERRLWFGLLAGSAALTLAVYGSALSLPFFFDDFVHIPFVDTHGLGEIWLTAQGLAYYRPLAFTVWKLLALLLGHHDPVAQHAVNLLVHWANGLMVAWLAGRLWSHHRAIVWPRRYLSAALFLLFPFSYQAVPWVGALSHPLVTALILLSLVAYLKFRDAGHRGWGAVSLAVTFLAPFAHENGALVGPLMALVEWTQPWRDDSIGRTFLRTAAWALPALVWFPIWRLAPQAVVASAALNSGEALMQNGLYFLQGIAYPVTWLGGWLRAEQSVNDLVAIFVLSTPLFLIAAFVQMRSRDRRAWLPWLWCGLTALPAVAFLKFDYVINGPRLLVLASVGAAWLWTDVALRLVAWSAPAGLLRRMGAAIAAALTLAVLAQNAFFIHDRMLLHDLGGSALRHAIVAAIAANDGGQAAIFINLPAWLAPIRSTFALGHEGVQFLPSYAPDEKIVSVDTGRPAAIRAFRFDEIRPEMPYLYGLRGSTPDWSALAQNGGQVLVTRYAPDAIEVETAGRITRDDLRRGSHGAFRRRGDAVRRDCDDERRSYANRSDLASRSTARG